MEVSVKTLLNNTKTDVSSVQNQPSQTYVEDAFSMADCVPFDCMEADQHREEGADQG